MPRKSRPCHTERVYHVFSRGNYKLPIFEEIGAVTAFLEALDEILQIFNWEVYALVIMPNHFHLCVRTPDGDLSAGMHRLLTTFCARFNRFRGVSGHVFQGRFKSVVAPEGLSVRRIIDYIHLNPVRAGLCDIDGTALQPASSLRCYLDPAQRGRLAVDKAFARFIGFPDTPQGRRDYLAELHRIHAQDPHAKKLKAEWKSGLEAEKAAERKAAGPIQPERHLTRSVARQQAEERWASQLAQALARHGLTDEALRAMRKADPAKLRLARELRSTCTAPYSWLAAHLHAGTAQSLQTRLNEEGVRP